MSRREHRRRAPPDPEPWRRHLTPDLYDNPRSVAWAKGKDENDQAMRDFNRALIEHYELHKACPLDRCRRARRCAGRELLCYNAVEPLLRERVFPKLHAALNKRAAAADMSPESPL